MSDEIRLDTDIDQGDIIYDWIVRLHGQVRSGEVLIDSEPADDWDDYLDLWAAIVGRLVSVARLHRDTLPPSTSAIIAALETGDRIERWWPHLGAWRDSRTVEDGWGEFLDRYGDQAQPGYRIRPKETP